MASYEKITVRDFKKRLENSHYASLIGARRAIGRMSTWSDKEKDKARNIAAKYFGEVPPGKAPKKKRVAKKVSRKKAVKRSPKKVAKKKAAKKSAGRRAKVAGAPQSNRTVHDKLDESNAKTDAMRKVLDELERTRRLGVPDTEVAHDAKKAQAGLSAIIDEICALSGQITSGPTSEEQTAANDFVKAARASSPGGNGMPVKSNPKPTQPQLSGALPDGAQV